MGSLQTARDKYARSGMRLVEFLDPELMTVILKEKQFTDHSSLLRDELVQKLVDSYAAEREFLAPFLKQDHVALREHGHEYKFATNAHGVGLDINAGLYPGITSSHPAKAPRWTDTAFGV